MCGYVFSENKDSSFENFKEIVKLSSLSLRGDNPINFAELPHGHLLTLSLQSQDLRPLFNQKFLRILLFYTMERYITINHY